MELPRTLRGHVGSFATDTSEPIAFERQGQEKQEAQEEGQEGSCKRQQEDCFEPIGPTPERAQEAVQGLLVCEQGKSFRGC